jgi:hypothetical protein
VRQLHFREFNPKHRPMRMNAIEPKLQAFYDTLDARQKRAFDTGGHIGGIFNWWGKT